MEGVSWVTEFTAIKQLMLKSGSNREKGERSTFNRKATSAWIFDPQTR
jgi:hypothetical protein